MSDTEKDDYLYLEHNEIDLFTDDDNEDLYVSNYNNYNKEEKVMELLENIKSYVKDQSLFLCENLTFYDLVFFLEN